MLDKVCGKLTKKIKRDILMIVERRKHLHDQMKIYRRKNGILMIETD